MSEPLWQSSTTPDLRLSEGLLTPDETATLLQVSTETLKLWRRLRKGPDYVKAGRRVRYRLEDVRKWLELNVVATART